VPPDSTDANRWKALAVCLVAGFMTLLDVSIVNVAIPSIRTGLKASSSDLQWVTAGYALAFGLALVSAGRLGDARSRRLVFAVGLSVFTVSSALAGSATSPSWLVAARIVQGLGAGALSPQIAGFIQVLFKDQERAKAFGLFGAVVGISTAVGPLIGGALVVAAGQHDGWRWVFFVNVPIGAAALVLTRKYLPRGSEQDKEQTLDLIGVALLAIGLCLLLWPLVEGSETSLADRAWWLEAIAVVTLAGFFVWEYRLGRRGGQPIIDLALFKLRSFSLGTTMAAAYFAGFTPLFLVLTLYLQTGLKYNALLAGVTGIPFALGSAVTATLGSKVVLKLGRKLILGGLIAVVIGVAAIVIVVDSVHTDVGWALAVPLLIAGLGGGLVIAPNQTLTLAEVDEQGGGSGAGVLQTAQRVGAAVGIAVVSAIFFAHIAGASGSAGSTGGSTSGGPDDASSSHLASFYASGLRLGLYATLVFLVVAVLIGFFDVVSGSSVGSGRHERAEEKADDGPRHESTSGDSPAAHVSTGSRT
jgi:EmrB/QacA subfamily drug resistance transporter